MNVSLIHFLLQNRQTRGPFGNGSYSAILHHHKATITLESEVGREQIYHHLSNTRLCNGGAMKQKYKRNPYRIINKSHQYRFLALILIYIIIITGVLVSVLFVPDIIRMNDQSLSIEVRTVAAENILMLHYRVWPVIIAFICVIGLHSIRTFNRFIGPLYRLT
jgi:hypothetical protein